MISIFYFYNIRSWDLVYGEYVQSVIEEDSSIYLFVYLLDLYYCYAKDLYVSWLIQLESSRVGSAY